MKKKIQQRQQKQKYSKTEVGKQWNQFGEYCSSLQFKLHWDF